MVFLQSLQLAGLLSFPPGSEPIPLTPLNVLIGPNGSGKSNVIEAVELLHATPTAFAAAIRDGGGVRDWLWKGEIANPSASIEAVLCGMQHVDKRREQWIDYCLAFTAQGQHLEVVEECIRANETPGYAIDHDLYYYGIQDEPAALEVRNAAGGREVRELPPGDLVPSESILSQRKGADVYPEITWLGQQFARIQTFREWSFGRSAPLRQPQSTSLPSDALTDDSRNLGLLLNALEHTDAASEFNRLMARFLPRYRRFSTRVEGGTIQIYLHEDGLGSPVPATRLSDGTIRFMAMLALLLSPAPPPLLCIEEPELGQHPDAVCLLADVLVEASTRTQIIVTTHSDALVSALSEHAESVLVCEYAGGTVLRRVEAAKIAHWLEKYRLGEIWRIGELGGNP